MIRMETMLLIYEIGAKLPNQRKCDQLGKVLLGEITTTVSITITRIIFALDRMP